MFLANKLEPGCSRVTSIDDLLSSPAIDPSIHTNTKCINSHKFKKHQFTQIQNKDPVISENVIKKGAALPVEICLHIIVEGQTYVQLIRSSTIKRDHAVLTK